VLASLFAALLLTDGLGRGPAAAVPFAGHLPGVAQRDPGPLRAVRPRGFDHVKREVMVRCATG